MDKELVFYVKPGSKIYRALIYKVFAAKSGLQDLDIQTTQIAYGFKSDTALNSPIETPQFVNKEIVYRIYPNGKVENEYLIRFKPVRDAFKNITLDLEDFYEKPKTLMIYGDENLSHKELRSVVRETFDEVVHGVWMSADKFNNNQEKSQPLLNVVTCAGGKIYLEKFNVIYASASKKYFDYEAEFPYKHFIVSNSKDIGHGYFPILKMFRFKENDTQDYFGPNYFFERKSLINNQQTYHIHQIIWKKPEKCFQKILVKFKKNKYSQPTKKPYCYLTNQAYEYDKEYLLNFQQISQTISPPGTVCLKVLNASQPKWHEVNIISSGKIKDFPINQKQKFFFQYDHNGLNFVSKPFKYKILRDWSINHKSQVYLTTLPTNKRYLFYCYDWKVAFYEFSLEGPYKFIHARIGPTQDHSPYIAYEFGSIMHGMEVETPYYTSARREYGFDLTYELNNISTIMLKFSLPNCKKYILPTRNACGGFRISGDFNQAGKFKIHACTLSGYKKLLVEYDLPNDVYLGNGNKP